VTISAALREYAETPDRFSEIPAGGSVRRVADERHCRLEGPDWCSVSGVSVGADELAALVEEVRERVPAEKEPAWWIGPSARPPDLHERLEALGLGWPRDRAALLHAVVLTHDPGGETEGVTAGRVATLEQFAAARELQWDAFKAPERRRRRGRERFRQDFDELQRNGVPVWFVAELDGRPAGAAFAVPSARGVFMIGGATAPWARGRGLYRALVRARWEYAVARGTPALATHAVPDTSYPILRRLGFEDACTLRRLQEPAR
jgi:hypothetical protein